MDIQKDIDAVQAVVNGKQFIVTDQAGTVHCVPNDPRNRDYQIVQAWIDAGGTVQPAAAE